MMSLHGWVRTGYTIFAKNGYRRAHVISAEITPAHEPQYLLPQYIPWFFWYWALPTIFVRSILGFVEYRPYTVALVNSDMAFLLNIKRGYVHIHSMSNMECRYPCAEADVPSRCRRSHHWMLDRRNVRSRNLSTMCICWERLDIRFQRIVPHWMHVVSETSHFRIFRRYRSSWWWSSVCCRSYAEIMSKHLEGVEDTVKAQSPKYCIDGLASLLNAYVGLQDHYIKLENALS